MPLGAEQARRVYDRIGRAQDTQRFYEDKATSRLAELGLLTEARSVFELGCGTGRFAASLLHDRLPDDARYLGVDVSPKMAALASERLGRWKPRAQVAQVDPPALELPGDDGGFDRFVATYVFDLLTVEDARRLLAEAQRLTGPSGLLCAAGLTHGVTPTTELVSRGWEAVAKRRPSLLGGCRPIELCELLASGGWRVRNREVVARWGVPSEVVVASKGTTDGGWEAGCKESTP
jgi:ubiquinone/menaquinone biosynthesis C-methylase UbiE